GELLEQHVRLGVVSNRAGVIGVDARQVEFGEEPVELLSLGGCLLQGGDGDLVVAGLVCAEALLERGLRGSVLDAARISSARSGNQGHRQDPAKYPHSKQLPLSRRRT